MSPAETAAPLPYRLLGLPRFVLALLVVIWHALALAGPPGRWLLATDFGPVAVFAFFVLSGFIIGEAALAYYRGRPAAFLANRLLRLWPGYLVALAIMVLLLAATGRAAPGALAPANLAANAVALFPTVVVTDPLLGLAKRDELLPIVWALRVEFVFYGVVALVLLGGRLGAGAGWLVALLWAALAGSVVFHHLYGGLPRATFYFGMAPYFVLGAAWALRERLSGGGPLLPAAALLCLLHVLNFHSHDADAAAWQRPLDWTAAVAAGLLALLLLWSAWRLRRRPEAAGAARDRLLGNLTYELYLVHLPMIVLVGWLWPEPHWSSLLLALALSLAAAALLASLLGRLLRPLRQRLRRAATPSTP